MIIRIRSESKVTRVELAGTVSLQELYRNVSENVEEAKENQFLLTTDPAGTLPVPIGCCSLEEYNLKNGQMLFLLARKSKDDFTQNSSEPILDAVDILLEKQSGLIVRNKEQRSYCRHGPQGMCSNCQPLEPYDKAYAEEKGIKHLSFHAYLRKLGVRRRGEGGQSVILEEPRYKVKQNCPRHAPYPVGICTLCQPPAISLNPQKFRLTDHVEFEQPNLIETILAGWRENGYQRFSWLYGRYETYDVVPLGIKAVVSAIYEPPQDGSIDGFHLLEDPHEKVVEGAAKKLGLVKVGMIYTDLRDDGTQSGKVEYRRSPETFFLSSSECLFIADQQRLYPNPCRHSKEGGYYGSKFVTVVITGDEAHNIGLFAYQVSMTTVGMLEANLISATTDPSLMMVKPSSPNQYVPEVFYKYKNEHGAEVQTTARPTFPVDYLIVSLTHGFPLETTPMFTSPTIFVSPTKIPNLAKLAKYLLPIPSDPSRLLMILSDFNLFIFIFMLSITEEGIIMKADLSDLADAIIKKDLSSLSKFTFSRSWASLMTILQGQNPSLNIEDGEGSGRRGGERERERERVIDYEGWTCPHCTYINPSMHSDTCEVCSLPRKWD